MYTHIYNGDASTYGVTLVKSKSKRYGTDAQSVTIVKHLSDFASVPVGITVTVLKSRLTKI